MLSKNLPLYLRHRESSTEIGSQLHILNMGTMEYDMSVRRIGLTMASGLELYFRMTMYPVGHDRILVISVYNSSLKSAK